MVDRKICRKCIYGSFHDNNSLKGWKGCNYLLYTNKKRPHDGDICFGFTARNDKEYLILDPYNKIITKGEDTNGQ